MAFKSAAALNRFSLCVHTYAGAHTHSLASPPMAEAEDNNSSENSRWAERGRSQRPARSVFDQEPENQRTREPTSSRLRTKQTHRSDGSSLIHSSITGAKDKCLIDALMQLMLNCIHPFVCLHLILCLHQIAQLSLTTFTPAVKTDLYLTVKTKQSGLAFA